MSSEPAEIGPSRSVSSAGACSSSSSSSSGGGFLARRFTESSIWATTWAGTERVSSRSSSTPASPTWKSRPTRASQSVSARRPEPPLPAGQLDQRVDDLGPEGLAGRVAVRLGRRVPQGRGAELGVVAPDLGQPVPPLDQHVVDQVARRGDLPQVVERLGHQAGVEHALGVGHVTSGRRRWPPGGPCGSGGRAGGGAACRASSGTWPPRPARGRGGRRSAGRAGRRPPRRPPRWGREARA